MSLILGYANTQNAFIMSDGRSGGTTHPSEHCSKTLKINDNIIIGFAGYLEDVEFILHYISNEISDQANAIYIDDFWDVMCHIMNQPEAPQHIRSSFVIIGRRNNGKMYTSIIGDSTNYLLEKNEVTSERICSIGGTINGKVINNIILENFSQANIPIFNRFSNAVSQVSQLDSSVNCNIFYVDI